MAILYIRDEHGNLVPIPTTKGEKGEKGDKGDDGHTPIKGTDYWTAADQASIVADVLAALPDGDGVEY